MNREPVRTIMWRSLWFPGLEICSLMQTAGGYRLEGTALAVLDDRPQRAFYRVRCDSRWRTRSVRVSLGPGMAGNAPEALELRASGDGRWWSGEGELAALRGCIDIDLGITPATNTLPVRRLGLAVGQSAEIRAAWVRFPGLEISPLAQRYTRLEDRRYRYESDSFSAELELDELGLVIRYEGAWERIASE